MSAQCPAFTFVHTRSYYGAGSNWPTDSASVAYPVSNASGFAYQRQSTLPLSPDSSRPCVQLPSGFQAQLWASERSPGGGTRSMIAMTWDEKGRLWGVETRDYPNRVLSNPLPGGGGADRIVIISDANGDGQADTRKVFAEGYNLLTGIVHTAHGVVVAMAPHILLLKDENGDDVADDPQGQILYTGFGRGDTHATISNLHYGLDNWIYASIGYAAGSNIRNPVTNQTFSGSWSQRIMRFKTDGTAIEAPTTVTNNTWGIGISETGQIFASAANRDHSFHQVYPGLSTRTPLYSGADRSYKPQIEVKSNAGAGNAGAGNGIYAHPRPITNHVNINNGGYPATSNHSVYTARQFPQKYWDRFAFTCDAPHHLCHQFALEPYRSTWRAVEDTMQHNIFASTDPWVAPIMATVGPDGALWVLDWYNYLNNHNGICGNTATGGNVACGTGAAMISNVRDTVRTRVYRVVYAPNPVDAILNLSTATDDQLIQAFYHTNMLWRLQAQRLLVKKGGNPDRIAKLRALLDSNTVNSMGEAPHTMHALRTLEGYGLFASAPETWVPVLSHLMLHPSPGVRWNAIDALPNNPLSIAAILDQGRINDPDAHVRLRALYKLGILTGAKSGAMYTPYVTLDAHSQNRFNAVTGLTQTATMPTIPPLRNAGTSIETSRPLFARRIQLSYRDGFFSALGLDPAASGSLVVRDVRGAQVASLPIARGKVEGSVALRQGAYLYRVELRGGVRQDGKFSVFH